MLELLEFGNRFVVGIFDIYIIVLLLDSIFYGKHRNKQILSVAILIDISVMMLMGYYVPPVYINMIASISVIFLFTCCYKSSFKRKIYATIVMNILIMLSESLIALFMHGRDLSIFTKAQNEESLALFLSRIVMWIIVLVAKRFILKDKQNYLSIKIVILEAILFISMIYLLLFLGVGKQESISVQSAVLLVSEITVYLMIYLQDCVAELYQSKEVTKLVSMEKEYYRKEASLIHQKNELEKQFRHDWKNKLQVLYQIAEDKQVSELKKYLQEIDDNSKIHTLYSKTGNLIIDSIINSKLCDASNYGINVNADIIFPTTMNINEDDMVIIFGNLLDNAIEACQRESEKKYIDLKVFYESGCIMINVINSYDSVINESDGEYITRKENKELHGLGIKSVKKTVNKYNGIMEISSENNEFMVNVILYL